MKQREKAKEIFQPGKPPKNYRKPRAVGLFLCRDSSFQCVEILRATVAPAGDVYIFPFLNEISDFHVSHHQLGECHWTDEGKHLVPRDGADDLANAFSLWLRVKCFTNVPCICLRRGRSLGHPDLAKLMTIMVKYLPFPADSVEIAGPLATKGFSRFEMSHQWKEMHPSEKKCRDGL
jgi:hypothetical protein